MNTWLIGNIPVAHQLINYPEALFDVENNVQKRGEKVFYMKGRIMAGQANVEASALGCVDYRWACREEVRECVSPREWSSVRNVIAGL